MCGDIIYISMADYNKCFAIALHGSSVGTRGVVCWINHEAFQEEKDLNRNWPYTNLNWDDFDTFLLILIMN